MENKITFLGCFEIHKGRPHWEGIKEGCRELGVNAEFIGIRKNPQRVDGDIGIALTRDATNYLGDFNKKYWWQCDYESEIDGKNFDGVILSSPNYEVLNNSNCPFWFLPQASPRCDYIKTERKKDLVFLGNINRGRARERTKFLMELSKHFSIDFVQDRYTIQDLKEIYPQYKIALSLNFRDDVFSTSNRPFLIMGFSGFCLARENPLMKRMFDNVVYFRDLEDACKKIEYYLKHDEERENIRYNQWLEIQNKHLYSHRIKRLLEICDLA